MKRLIAAAIPVATALIAACLDPRFHGQDLLIYTDDATGATVATAATAAGSGFKLHFAGGSGLHFPDALTIDGSSNLLGSDPNPVCFDESSPGFLLFPLLRVSDDGGAPASQAQLTPVLRGPAVVQVKLEWTTRFKDQCSPTRAPGGTSTFTVFPDGRILRHDVLRDASQTDLSATDCQCLDPGDMNRGKFFVSTYWSFVKGMFPKAYGLSHIDPLASDALPAPDPGSITSGYRTVCFDGNRSAYQVVSTWVSPRSDDTGVVFGHDTLVAHDLQKPISSTNLDVPWDVHGTLFIDRSDCATALGRAVAATAPQKLTINGTPTLPSELDGMYGGDPGNGMPGIDVPEGRTPLSGPVNGPFVVWLRFPRAAMVPVATRDSATGTWYVPQRVDGRNWIVWFRDGLQGGETITVEPD